MEASQVSISCCQRCRHFALEGRRGGYCGQLNVPVQGRWSACSLSSPVFSDPIDVVTRPYRSVPTETIDVRNWPDDLMFPSRDLKTDERDRLVEPV